MSTPEAATNVEEHNEPELLLGVLPTVLCPCWPGATAPKQDRKIGAPVAVEVRNYESGRGTPTPRLDVVRFHQSCVWIDPTDFGLESRIASGRRRRPAIAGGRNEDGEDERPRGNGGRHPYLRRCPRRVRLRPSAKAA